MSSHLSYTCVSQYSFCKGLKQYGDNAEELCLNLYYFFKNNPSRREDLFEMEDMLDLEEMVTSDISCMEIGES